MQRESKSEHVNKNMTNDIKRVVNECISAHFCELNNKINRALDNQEQLTVILKSLMKEQFRDAVVES